MQRKDLGRRPNKHAKTSTSPRHSEEVCSSEWEFIEMSKEEEDLIYRMYRLVGDRWELIAGRIPNRKAEEIERFWIMRNCDVYAERRKLQKRVPRN